MNCESPRALHFVTQPPSEEPLVSPTLDGCGLGTTGPTEETSLVSFKVIF